MSLFHEIKTALEVLDVNEQRLQNEGYRSKNGLWARIVRATGKPSTLRRRRQFYDIWRKTTFTSQHEAQELQESSLSSPALPLPAPQEFCKTDQLIKTGNGGEEDISRTCVQVYDIINRCLLTDEVVRLLTNVDVSKVSSLQPVNPRSGEVYVYKFRKGQENGCQDWRPEYAPWTNMGTKHVAHPRGFLKKQCFVARGEGREIEKRMYELSENVAPYVLVHYLDENSRFQRPYRPNVGFGKQPFAQIAQPEEVLKIGEEELEIPPKVHKHSEMITENSFANSKPDAETSVPTSMEQNPNTEGEKACVGTILNITDIMATQVMCRELKDFVIQMSIFPDVVVVAALPEMTEQFQVMVTNSGPQVPHILYYNNSLDLEIFHVTPLLFCHNDFEECPAVPLAFLIHQHQKEKAHTIFLEELLCLLPDLNSSRFLICTDCKDVVENSVKTVLPNASAVKSPVQLMNHLLGEVDVFCGGDSTNDDNDCAYAADVRMYMSSFRALLHSKTEEEWRINLRRFSNTWSSAFVEYFQMHLEVMMKRSAWFTLKALGLPQFETISRNVFSRFSLMLKETLIRKLRLETAVFTVFQLSTYFLNEVLSSCCNTGPYQLTPASTKNTTAIDNLDFPEDVMTPEEIVLFVQDSLADDNMADQGASGRYGLALKRPMAKLIIEKNKLTLEPSAQAFLVSGWRGQKYIVKLYPEEHCSCFVGQHCWHILAARTSIGFEEEGEENRTFRVWKVCEKAEETLCGEKGITVLPLEEFMLTKCSPGAGRGDTHKHYLLTENTSSTSESAESNTEEANEDSE